MGSANFSRSLWVRGGAATGPRQAGPVALTLLPPITCQPRGHASLILSSGCTLPVLGRPWARLTVGPCFNHQAVAGPRVPPELCRLLDGGQGDRGAEARPHWPLALLSLASVPSARA